MDQVEQLSFVENFIENVIEIFNEIFHEIFNEIFNEVFNEVFVKICTLYELTVSTFYGNFQEVEQHKSSRTAQEPRGKMYMTMKSHQYKINDHSARSSVN